VYCIPTRPVNDRVRHYYIVSSSIECCHQHRDITTSFTTMLNVLTHTIRYSRNELLNLRYSSGNGVHFDWTYIDTITSHHRRLNHEHKYQGIEAIISSRLLQHRQQKNYRNLIINTTTNGSKLDNETFSLAPRTGSSGVNGEAGVHHHVPWSTSHHGYG
jgi:hypothetical protein